MTATAASWREGDPTPISIWLFGAALIAMAAVNYVPHFALPTGFFLALCVAFAVAGAIDLLRGRTAITKIQFCFAAIALTGLVYLTVGLFVFEYDPYNTVARTSPLIAFGIGAFLSIGRSDDVRCLTYCMVAAFLLHVVVVFMNMMTHESVLMDDVEALSNFRLSQLDPNAVVPFALCFVPMFVNYLKPRLWVPLLFIAGLLLSWAGYRAWFLLILLQAVMFFVVYGLRNSTAYLATFAVFAGLAVGLMSTPSNTYEVVRLDNRVTALWQTLYKGQTSIGLQDGEIAADEGETGPQALKRGLFGRSGQPRPAVTPGQEGGRFRNFDTYELLLNRFISEDIRDDSRIREAAYAFGAFLARPVFGAGFGQMIPGEVIYGEDLAQLEQYETGGYLHLQLPYYLMSGGLIGFLILYSAHLLVLTKMRNRARLRGAMPALTSVACLFLAAQTSAMYQLPHYSVLVVLALHVAYFELTGNDDRISS
ncbi:O-antigen ligase family protein [Oceaniradius stylonematis]|uniref:O-antigen ligase family protein n=1 Tax=Oceaniradius stylonematis TaxID=2184161 RepID=UPI00273DB6BD|nr:O-antigen ligase family protein [Oceaniradius stylonematis]